MISANAFVTVAFQDCDPMQVVWHGNYYRYLEEARRALLEKIDFSYQEMALHGFAYPIVDTRMKFVSPAQHAHRLEITARLTEWENRLRMDFVVFNHTTGKVCVKAHTIQCAVQLNSQEMLLASPQCLLDKVAACYK
ncbi:acyl-CoA thioesterase [Vibrio agarivorans]|uniref:acyl-CoA thioesterase n=1 Tax=Vibrio agarivorans TaxID=153622 RepID=UPI00222F604C|nr:acyl-CoA thioesterase [Vibrio agarivorans]